MLVGKKIEYVRQMTPKEHEQCGWGRDFDHLNGPPVVVQLEGGVKLYAMGDPEGNCPGCLCAAEGDSHFYVMPEKFTMPERSIP